MALKPKLEKNFKAFQEIMAAVTLEDIKGLLEQAIRETVATITSSPSRKPRQRAYRPRLKDEGIVRGTKGGNGWDDNGGALAQDEEAIYWQSRYEELKASTTGDSINPAILELEQDLKQAQDREDAAEKLCRDLEKKIERLQSPNTSRRALQEVLSERVEDRRLILEFMEWLSSTSVRHNVEEGGRDDFICTVKNPREKKVTRFSILADNTEAYDQFRARPSKLTSTNTSGEMDEKDMDVSQTDEEEERGAQITYIPRANIDQLPDYLRQPVKFDRDMAPVLMLDVLNAIYGDDDDDGGMQAPPNPQFRGTGIGLGETEER